MASGRVSLCPYLWCFCTSDCVLNYFKLIKDYPSYYNSALFIIYRFRGDMMDHKPGNFMQDVLNVTFCECSIFGEVFPLEKNSL